MPAPIQYPSRQQTYRRDPVGDDLSRLRAQDQRRPERLPKLRSHFRQINERCFDGMLPEPVLEFADDLDGAAAHCHSNRAMAWSQPYTIRFDRRHVDDPKSLTRFLAHELAHLAGFAVADWYETDGHGRRFYDILGHIERGERYTAGLSSVESRAATQSAARRGGMVRAGGTYSFHDMRRGRSAAVEKGELVPADSWFVGKPNTEWLPA